MNKQQKRAKSLVAMGMVSRDGDTYTVQTPTLKQNEEIINTVSRSDTGRIVCDCEDFKAISQGEPHYRCEHILAVKEFLITAVGEKKSMSETKETDFEEVNHAQGLRSIRNIVRDLSKPVAKRHLRTRKQGGKNITYISWHDAVKYLDHYAPGWNYEIKSLDTIGGKLVMTVRISIPCSEGIVYREATGQEDENKENYGDASSNSESMALRRAAAKFGLGLYLYDQ